MIIQKHTLLDRKTVNELQHKERLLQAHKQCIRKLSMRDYTTKELRQYLKNQRVLEEAEIEQILTDLTHKGYLNDYQYMMNKIEKMQYSLKSKGKIIQSLVDKGVSHEEVARALDNYDDSQESAKAVKLAEKLKSTVKDKSLSMKRKVIAQKLVRQGFESNVAYHASEAVEFEDEDDKNALQKTMMKAIRTNQRKYQGTQLRNRVIHACIKKGFKSSDVLSLIDEMEWQNEKMDE